MVFGTGHDLRSDVSNRGSPVDFSGVTVMRLATRRVGLDRALAAAVAVALLVMASMGSPPRANADTEVFEWGYVAMSDGVKIRYAVRRPAGDGPFPTVIGFGPYAEGLDPSTRFSELRADTPLLVEAGYAVVGATIRGTGCSGGELSPYGEDWGRDGAELVEWAAAQPWSTGKVAMIGPSALGISALMTAGLDRDHLAAVAVESVPADLYRDVFYPGGIPNTGITTLLAAATADPEYWAPAVREGDTVCAEHVAARMATGNEDSPFSRIVAHRFDDEFWETHGPRSYLDEVDVPVLVVQEWQDDLLIRSGPLLLEGLDPHRSWSQFTPGWHRLLADDPEQRNLLDFLDHYVAGRDTAWPGRPHVHIWHETTRGEPQPSSSCDLPPPPSDATPRPRGQSWHRHYSAGIEPHRLYLQPDGALSADPPTIATSATSYAYPATATPYETVSHESNPPTWGCVAPAAANSVAFTTEPLEEHVEILGPASADLWMSTLADSTDVQVTLTEVRDDGQEVYIQRGFLRLSHRELDPQRSTELRPYHTHREEDVEAMADGELVRIEIRPVNHVFRAGSRIRLWVEAPTTRTGFWQLAFDPSPSINTVHHEALRPSSLVLGRVPQPRVPAWSLEQPACGTTIGQPCRPDPEALP